MISFPGLGIIICVISLLATWAIPNIKSSIDSLTATFFAKKIQATIMKARLLAIQQHSAMLICPSNNKIDCSNSWQHANYILIISQKSSQLKKIISIAKVRISWYGFGSTTNLSISKYGYTEQNGHFSIYSRDLATCYIKIYVNKAAKTYLKY